MRHSANIWSLFFLAFCFFCMALLLPHEVLADETTAAFTVDALVADNTDQALNSYDPLAQEPVPTVLTASRLRQSKTTAPATVTVLEGRQLRELGIIQLWEVFRLVPGMTVQFVRSNIPIVTYHGLAGIDQRRMQVLIDGRAMYNAGLADIDWHNMPVPLENIDRIEVVRGPSAASYGINAFLATINIITKKPADTQGVQARMVYGDTGVNNQFASLGERYEKFDWRLSLSHKKSDGFDKRLAVPTPPQTFDSNNLKKANDGFTTRLIDFSSTYEFSSSQSLTFNAGRNTSDEEADPAEFSPVFGVQTDPNITGRDWYAQIKFDQQVSDSHSWYLQTYYQKRQRNQNWRSCVPLGLFGISPPNQQLCADVDQDFREARADIEFQDTLQLSDQLRVVSGASYREDSFTSSTYFNGSDGNQLIRAFGNAEYGPATWLTVNAGGLWESDTNSGNFFSPRGALNFHLTNDQVLRFVLSKAVRTPDPFEQSANWGYQLRNVQPAQVSALEGLRLLEFQAPGNLSEEQILSREISYYGRFRLGDGIFSTEVKLFRDTITDLISGTLDPVRWNIDNNLQVKQQGVELETSYEWPSNSLRLTYAYMDQDGKFVADTTNLTPKQTSDFVESVGRSTANHSGSASWVHRFPHQISWSNSFYYADKLDEWDFKRLDARLAKGYLLPKMTIEIAALLQYTFSNAPLIRTDNILEQQTLFFVEASVGF